jgi:hypothetical protein
MNTQREHASEDPGCRRYNWCPTCQELRGAVWMAHAGLQSCPSCEGPVLAYIGRSPYDADARAELRPGPILEGAEGGVNSHG